MPINVDITKAKVITKDRLRADRTPLLAAQDILFMKAQETGSATISTSEYGSFEENKKTIIDKAIEAACLNVLDKYTDTFSTARLTNYEKIQELVESNLGNFVNCSAPIDENMDFATNEFSVVIKASVNTSKIDKELQDVSAINNSDDPMEIVLLVLLDRSKVLNKKMIKLQKLTKLKHL